MVRRPDATQIALLDVNGVIVDVNAAWLSFMRANGGVEGRCGVGVSILEVLRDAEGEGDGEPTVVDVRRALEAALQGAALSAGPVTVACHAPDEERWFEEYISPRVDLHDRPIGATVMFVPVASPLAPAIVWNELSRSRVRLMVEAAPDGMLLVDEGGTIVFANARLADIFGFASADRVVGSSVDELLPAATRSRHAGLRAGYHDEPRLRTMGEGRWLLGRRRDGTIFPVEVSLSPVSDDGGFAVIATVRDISDRTALEILARHDRDELATAHERSRISRDLHDVVIQRLFGVGMTVQAALAGIDSNEVRVRLESAVDQLEATIREIRITIAGVSRADRSRSFEVVLSEAIVAWSDQLGFVPTTSIIGDLRGLPTSVFDEMLPCLTEALSNVARHAHATHARVSITASPNLLALVVADNGQGIDAGAERGLGLDNLGARAALLGGVCQIGPNPDGGTLVSWQVPLHGR